MRKAHQNPGKKLPSKRTVRHLLLEVLENRQLLNVDWRNPTDNLDVSSDGSISPIDALLVINRLNTIPTSQLPASRPAGSAYVDTNGDGRATPIDALLVINWLNRNTIANRRLSDSGRFQTSDDFQITVGQSSGERLFRMSIEPTFVNANAGSLLSDIVHVYVLNPGDPTSTLLDRGSQGTPVWSLTPGGVDLATGISRWDGRVLELDLSSITTHDTALIRLQLVNGNAQNGTSVVFRPLSNQVSPALDVDQSDQVIPTPINDSPIAAGASLALSSLRVTTDVVATVQRTSLNSAGDFDGEVVLSNLGESAGSTVAMVLHGLPASASLVNASGLDPQGRPYLNLSPAIGRGGLGSNQRSAAVQFQISNPQNVLLNLTAVMLVGSPNRSPIISPVTTQSVMPGASLTIPIQATDPDGDRIEFALRTPNSGQRPDMRLDTQTGVIVVQPSPGQLGSSTVEVVATDGLLTATRTFQLNVVGDSDTTTRLSGRILDADGSPLAGLRVDAGNVQALTQSDGRFTLNFGNALPSADTLRVRGELYRDAVRPEVRYPFIAEKIKFLFGRDLYAGFNNVLDRAIYLPKLNPGTAVDATADVVISAALRPGTAPVSVDIRAGSLFTQQSTPFTGQLSITEVPVDFTPAALPDNLRPDMLVTIQPGEMVFSTPAPLTFPNTPGYTPGTILDLWSINPVTGEFDDVGDLQVSEDGTVMKTVSGGIRNSSWHFPSPPPVNPGTLSPGQNGNNADPNGDRICPKSSTGPGPAAVSQTSTTCLYSGELKETHTTIPYTVAGDSYSVTLSYSSLRANPRPIIHFGLNNIQPAQNDRLAARVTLQQGNARWQIGSDEPGGNDLNWRVPEAPSGTTMVNVSMAIQADLSSLPSGVYDYTVSYGPGRWSNEAFTGTLFDTSAQLIVVNGQQSPYGVGWSVAGLQQILVNPDNSLLLIDGDGSEVRFAVRAGVPGTYDSPTGDFSVMTGSSAAGWTRRLSDGTRYQFGAGHGRLEEIVDRIGNRTRFQYNAAGSLDTITDPTGQVTRFEYTAGRLSRIVDPAGRSTLLEHDARGNLARVVDPDGAARQWRYDARHLMVGETDASGQVESSFYDEFGRQTGGVRKDGSQYRVQPAAVYGLYSLDKLLNADDPPTALFSRPGEATFIDGRGEITQYTIDRNGETVTTRDRVGQADTYGKDVQGRVREVQDARGYSTWYSYDQQGNVIEIQDEITQSRDIFPDPYTRVGFNPAGPFGPIQYLITSLTQADLNGDGTDDLIIGHDYARVSLLYGTESGRYSEPQLILPSAEMAAESSNYSGTYPIDLNADGRVDLLHVSTGLGALLNNGDGTWRSGPVSGLLQEAPFSIEARFGHFNQDSHIDLVRPIGNGVRIEDGITRNFPRFQLFLGAGDGSFQTGPIMEGMSTFYVYQQMEIADLNGDQHLDVITLARSAEDGSPLRLQLFMGAGNGTFTGPVYVSTGIDLLYMRSLSFRAVDMDADNDSDILMADEWLLVNQGQLNFQVVSLAVGEREPEILLAHDRMVDLDDDGDLDIVRMAGAYVGGYGQVLTLVNQGGNVFSEVSRQPVGRVVANPEAFVVTRNAADGSYQLEVAKPNGVATFELNSRAVSPQPIDLETSFTASLRTADLNGDGWDDLVYEGQDQSRWQLWARYSTGPLTFSDPIQVMTDMPTSFDIGDVTGSPLPDIVASVWTGSEYLVHVLRNEGQRFELAQTFSAGEGAQLRLGNFRGTGRKDLLVSRGYYESALGFANRDGVFSAPETLNMLSRQFSIADFNRDGLDDLYYTGTNTGQIGVRWAQRGGWFGEEGRYGTQGFNSPTAGDVNADGVPDLITAFASRFTNYYEVLIGDGNGFISQRLFDVDRARFSHGQLRDIDVDGDLDLVSWLESDGVVRIYENNGRGEFGQPRHYSAGSSDIPSTQFLGADGLVLIDLDRDGYQDLLFVDGLKRGQLQYRLNQLGGSGQRWEYESNFGQWTRYTDELGRVTLRAIDSASGQVLSETQVVGQPGGADDLVTRYTYTAFGLVDTITNPEGRVTDYDYDATGRMTRVTEALGTPLAAVTLYEYDLAGNLVAEQNALGARKEYRYDSANRLVEMRDADPDGPGPMARPVWQYEYDARGNQVSLTDPRGFTTRTVFDALGQVVQTIDALGGTTSYSYDTVGNLVAMVDELGRRTSYRYDSRGRLLETIDPLGGRTTQSFDAVGNRTARVDPSGARTEYVFDARNRLVTTRDALRHVYRTIYNQADEIITLVDARGLSTQFQYDDVGRPVAEVDPLGNISRTKYNRNGEIVEQVDRLGRTTRMEYDQLGQQRRVEDALGGVTAYQYDAVGNMVSETDALGRVTAYRYDLLNRLSETIDAAGGRWQSTYDANDNLLSSIDALGRETRFTYDALGRSVTSTDAAGGVVTTSHDATGNVVSVTDQRGSRTQYRYDALDRVIQTTDALGNVWQKSYDAVGNIITETDPLLRTTRYQYDLLDRPTKVVDPLGAVTDSQYDAVGNLTKSTNARGHTTEFQYDALNRLVQTTDALGGRVVTQYDAENNLRRIVDQLGNVAEIEYDDLDRPVLWRNALGAVRRASYDAVGNRVTETDPRGSQTAYAYDSLDRVTDITDALQNKTRFTYDLVGNRTTVSDGLQRVTTFVYDTLNRTSRVIEPSGASTRFEYDATSNATAVIDPLGNRVGATWDVLSRLSQHTDAMGNTTRYFYDAVGNITRSQDALLNEMRFGYDAANRQVEQIDPLGNKTQQQFDLTGNLIAVIDPQNQVTQYSYDSLSRKTSVVDPRGGRTSYEYDSASRLTGTTDPVGNRTTYELDRLGRVMSETNAKGAIERHQYDVAGNVIVHIDRNGRSRQFEYDALNRLTEERWLDSTGAVVNTIRQQFDAANQLLQISDLGSQLRYTYDVDGRQTSSSTAGTAGLGNVEFRYAYDAADRWTGRTDLKDGVGLGGLEKQYDQAGRPTRIVQSKEATPVRAVQVTYDALGRMTQLDRLEGSATQNLVLSTLSDFDRAGRMLSMQHKRGSTALENYAWTWDSRGKLTQTSSSSGVIKYAYDERGQLTSSDVSTGPDESFAYDANGNRVAGSIQTGSNNQLLVDGQRTFTYDANGNRVSQRDSSTGELTVYAWDHRDRLTEVTKTSNSGVVIQRLKFVYDVLDRRIGKQVDADGDGPQGFQQTWVAWDGVHEAFEWNASGQLTTQLFVGPFVDMVLAVGDGQGGTRWLLADHLGSTQLVTDAQGNVLDRIEYDSFGSVRTSSGTTPAVQWLYTGRRLDHETGLYSLRARYYDPKAGRFISEDPLGLGGGDANLSRYAENSPTTSKDPYGLRVWVAEHTIPAVERLGTYYHRAIILEPDNPQDFANDPLFMQSKFSIVPGVDNPALGTSRGALAGRVATLGGEPSNDIGKNPSQAFGNLIGVDNYFGDDPRKLAHWTLVDTPPGMTDSEFIRSLISAAHRYKNDQAYMPVPDGYLFYNSNSYVSGVIRAAGGKPPAIVDREAGEWGRKILPEAAPGYSKPLPIPADPKQTPPKAPPPKRSPSPAPRPTPPAPVNHLPAGEGTASSPGRPTPVAPRGPTGNRCQPPLPTKPKPPTPPAPKPLPPRPSTPAQPVVPSNRPSSPAPAAAAVDQVMAEVGATEPAQPTGNNGWSTVRLPARGITRTITTRMPANPEIQRHLDTLSARYGTKITSYKFKVEYDYGFGNASKNAFKGTAKFTRPATAEEMERVRRFQAVMRDMLDPAKFKARYEAFVREIRRINGV